MTATVNSFSKRKYPSTTDTSDASSSRSLVIRRYEPTDQDQVQALFRRGMLSLVPRFARNMLFDPYVFVPMGAVTGLIQYGISRALSLFLGPSSSTNHHRTGSTHSMISSLPLLGSTSFVLASIFMLYRIGFGGMEGYIRQSLASDLADIPKHYFANGGTFLVAEDTTTGRIVGIVGGEHKETNSIEGEKNFELRRMSVDATIQRQGLGRRLVTSLEERLRQAGCTHLFLTMSSLQTSAYHLYTKTGFLRTRKGSLEANAPLIVRRAIQFYQFDKYYPSDNKQKP